MQTTSNIDYFYGRFSVLGTIRILFKLKILNCSHLHHSESTIHQDLMIEVVIPEKIIMFHCGLIHCETSSWFIRRGGYSSNIRTFLQLLNKTLI